MGSSALSQELLKVATLFKILKQHNCGTAFYWYYAIINFKKYHMLMLFVAGRKKSKYKVKSLQNRVIFYLFLSPENTRQSYVAIVLKYSTNRNEPESVMRWHIMCQHNKEYYKNIGSTGPKFSSEMSLCMGRS